MEDMKSSLLRGVCKDVKLNSRGFFKPVEDKKPSLLRGVCKDGDFQYRGTFKSSDTLPFRVFTDAIYILPFIPTDLKVRGYSPSASRLPDAFSV